jgi:hypothetical protein
MATSTTIYRDCEYCRVEFGQPDDPGRKRRFCSNACRQAAYRARVRYGQRAREQREREEARRRAEEEARRAREEKRRRRRARQDRQPPPHAGTSRPRSWCGRVAAIAGRTPCTTTTLRTSGHGDGMRRSAGRRRGRALRTRRRRAEGRLRSYAPSTACSAGRPAAPNGT